MKSHCSTIAIAACLLACSCSDPTPSAITTTRYAMLAGSKSAKDQSMMMEFSIREPGKKSVAFAPRRMVTGKSVSFVSDREFIYPSAYLPAEISANGMAVTPATPTGFKSTNTGIEAKLTSSRKGGLIVVEGTVTVTEFLGFSRMGGELGRPMSDSKNRVLTENRIEMPMFGSYITPVFIAMSPGEDYSFEVSNSRKGTKVTLRLVPASR